MWPVSHCSGTSMKSKSLESGEGGAHCLWHKRPPATWAPATSTAPSFLAISDHMGFPFDPNQTWTPAARSGEECGSPTSSSAAAPSTVSGWVQAGHKVPAQGPS